MSTSISCFSFFGFLRCNRPAFLQRSVTVGCCFCLTPFVQHGIFLFLNFDFLFNLGLVFSCFLGSLQFLFCCHALMTFSILFSRHRSNFFLRGIVLLVRLGAAVGAELSVLLTLTCCWVCSFRMLLAVLFSPAARKTLLPAVGYSLLSLCLAE